MPRKSENLYLARQNRCDEFYTLYEDIENEMKFYDFKDKTVVCPCNDADKNFHKYFTDNFDKLGLKRLICVHYNPNGWWGGSFYYDNGEKKLLKGDGDFRSREVIELMKQGDYIITNPPFSLFSDFMRIMVDYNFKFCVIGNINGIVYKDVFPMLKEDRLWLGHTMRGGGSYFEVPEMNTKQIPTYWFQNIEKTQGKPLTLTEEYSPDRYPRYDNFDGIEVDEIRNIPKDYYEPMGVSVRFLEYMNDDWEILTLTKRDSEWRTRKYSKKDADNFSILNVAAVLIEDGQYVPKYTRVLIRRK